MKKLLVAFCMLALAACKKSSEESGPNYLVFLAMTNGQWKVTSYDQGGLDRSSDFSSYKFQFNTNFTVDAINNGTVEQTGTWTADSDNKTITSTFANASDPLDLLNGTWQITHTTWTSVDANQNVGGEVRILHLDKL